MPRSVHGEEPIESIDGGLDFGPVEAPGVSSESRIRVYNDADVDVFEEGQLTVADEDATVRRVILDQFAGTPRVMDPADHSSYLATDPANSRIEKVGAARSTGTIPTLFDKISFPGPITTPIFGKALGLIYAHSVKKTGIWKGFLIPNDIDLTENIVLKGFVALGTDDNSGDLFTAIWDVEWAVVRRGNSGAGLTKQAAVAVDTPWLANQPRIWTFATWTPADSLAIGDHVGFWLIRRGDLGGDDYLKDITVTAMLWIEYTKKYIY